MAAFDCPCQFEDSSHLGTSCGLEANVTMMMSLIDILIRSNCKLSDPCRRASRNLPLSKTDSFDFIVVGAGVAGPVLASRLSENPRWKILLLEAGPEEPTSTSIPAFAYSAIGTNLDWNYKTATQSDACLSNDGICKWPRGKMIGGTGAMTGMMYTRGHKNLFDSWAKDGIAGWSYDECLPYFKKSEANLNPDLIDEHYHGKQGPMPIQQFSSRPIIAKDLIEAGKCIGYEERDLNGRNQTGFAVAQMMVKDGLRASTPRMYLRPAMKRKNLVVKINSHVTKIIIDSWTKRTKGVEFIDNDGSIHRVLTKKEVILSAGTIGSPHLLLLSGIGPKNDLENFGIPVIQDLKVGHNLHNHVSMDFKFYINDINNNILTMDAVHEFMETQTGPLSSTGLTQVTAFLLSKYAEEDIPDLQVFFDGYSAHCADNSLLDRCSVEKSNFYCQRRQINVRPTNIMPRSRGYLKLKSKDPKDPPIIQPNYLTNKQDIDIIISGIKQIIDASKCESLKKWGIKLDRRPMMGCETIPFGTDGYWECVIKLYTGPENHPAGTCKMGPVGDPTAVVDPELRVHGILNLRIVDASIFPLVPNGNPVSSIIMAAEKASDMIKAAWKKR